MRLKLRKKKAKRLTYRKNWKSCSIAKTRVRTPLPFLQPSCALRSRFEALPLTLAVPFLGFALLFLGLLRSARAGAVCSRLRDTPTHFGLTRLLSHLMGSASRTSGTGCFASVRFGLVSPSGSHVAVVFGLELVPACSCVTCSSCLSSSCSLKITFSYVPRFVSTFSRSRSCRSSLAGACALTIEFGCVPDFVFTFACTHSSCSPDSLFAALALPHTFALIE